METSNSSPIFRMSADYSCSLYVAAGSLLTISLIGVGAILALHATNPSLFFGHGSYYLLGAPALLSAGALAVFSSACFAPKSPDQLYVFSEEEEKDDCSDSLYVFSEEVEKDDRSDSLKMESESSDLLSSSFSESFEDSSFTAQPIVVAPPIMKKFRVPGIISENSDDEYQLDRIPTSSRYWESDVVRAYPVASPLSMYWRDHQKWNMKKVALLAGLYPLGSIGFALALPYRLLRLTVRVGLLAKELIAGACGRSSSKEIKYHATMVGIAGLKFLSGFPGILCPPGAYWLERKIDDLTPEEDLSYFYFLKVDLKDALAVLEFPEDATPTTSEIKNQYHQVLLQNHPDKIGGGAAKSDIGQIKAAYKILDQYYKES